MKRVCFLGASTVEGLGDEGGLGWVGRLALLNRAAGHPIVSYNLGVRGQTLKQIAARAIGECSARIQDRGEDLIVVDQRLSTQRQIEVILNIFQQFDWDDVYVASWIRERLENPKLTGFTP